MHSREGGIHGNPEAATTQTPNPRVPAKRENGTSDSKNPKHHVASMHKKTKKLALTQSQSRLRANRAAMLAEGKDVDVLSQ